MTERRLFIYLYYEYISRTVNCSVRRRKKEREWEREREWENCGTLKIANFGYISVTYFCSPFAFQLAQKLCCQLSDNFSFAFSIDFLFKFLSLLLSLHSLYRGRASFSFGFLFIEKTITSGSFNKTLLIVTVSAKFHRKAITKHLAPYLC